jgi:hypothetical protein
MEIRRWDYAAAHRDFLEVACYFTRGKVCGSSSGAPTNYFNELGIFRRQRQGG